MRRLLEHTAMGLPLPDAPPGFEVTMLSCLPCGSRIDIDGLSSEDLCEWVLEHTDHINNMEENSFMWGGRPTWKSRR